MQKRPKVYIKCQNGIDFNIAIKDIFNEIEDQIEFIESDAPDFILFGPYGNHFPPKGKYIRIGYFCENIIPDLSICEWGFGIPREEEINNPRYKRIQWHGLKPDTLVKNLSDNDIDFIINQKQHFCNFIYSHPVAYRTHFFKELSKYKKIDAPGKSMNNMPSIDKKYSGNMWERKREFLSQYKFTIAFENYVYPGYQTEKLYDSMLCNSLPIYCGDPFVGAVFNTDSFVNIPDYLNLSNSFWIDYIEKNAQMTLTDILPQFHNNLKNKATRKVKSIARKLKMQLRFNRLNFQPVIERIIEIDQNQDLYIKYLKSPWLNHNKVSEHLSLKNRWLEIFNGHNK
ncbi:glycosyltransferase family 10 domain-containing protein [Pedobacter miscanthi]|uniref:glycosyltransferase family 10 domain-containing protein n=1 Tax=Pedobacter miscanthi TaxID=2259170 RepID=UPI00292E4DFC|nr:glycosyltransferase family 10 [Pedobacter miscanthi]